MYYVLPPNVVAGASPQSNKDISDWWSVFALYLLLAALNSQESAIGEIVMSIVSTDLVFFNKYKRSVTDTRFLIHLSTTTWGCFCCGQEAKANTLQALYEIAISGQHIKECAYKSIKYILARKREEVKAKAAAEAAAKEEEAAAKAAEAVKEKEQKHYLDRLRRLNTKLNEIDSFLRRLVYRVSQFDFTTFCYGCEEIQPDVFFTRSVRGCRQVGKTGNPEDRCVKCLVELGKDNPKLHRPKTYRSFGYPEDYDPWNEVPKIKKQIEELTKEKNEQALGITAYKEELKEMEIFADVIWYYRY